MSLFVKLGISLSAVEGFQYQSSTPLTTLDSCSGLKPLSIRLQKSVHGYGLPGFLVSGDSCESSTCRYVRVGRTVAASIGCLSNGVGIVLVSRESRCSRVSIAFSRGEYSAVGTSTWLRRSGV